MTLKKRIVLNTAATYGRQLFSLFVGLFSIRWVLAALGNEEYGLYIVVGSLIPFITFFNSVLGVSLTRYYAYALGEGTKMSPADAVDNMKRWFNTALSIHLVVPFILIVVGYPIAECAVRHWINIPVDRVDACVWVLRIALITTFISMASVPFIALYQARQWIAELSLFGILGSVCNFIGALCLSHVSSDRLIVYALYMMAINAGIPFLQCSLAIWRFRECRLVLGYWKDWKRLRSVVNFAGWSMLGGISSLVGYQGNILLTNRYFGAAINTSYGIAGQLEAQSSTLANALTSSLSPAVTTAAGAGDRDSMIHLAMKSGKFGAMLLAFFAVPLTLEMRAVLRLWLGQVPDYVVPVCIIILVSSIVKKMLLGQDLAIAAEGRIMPCQITGSITLLLMLPLTIGLVHYQVGPVAAAVSALICAVGCALNGLYWGRRLVGIRVCDWLGRVFLRVIGTAAVGVLCGLVVKALMCSGLLRVVVTSGTSCLSMVLAGWYVLLSEGERREAIRIISSKLLQRR